MTSASMMCAGDVLCQALSAARAGRALTSDASWLDATRSARFGLVGLTLHGPFFHRAFQWLDALPLASTSTAKLPQAVLRTLCGQLTIFPLYLVGFFTSMTLLEGRTIR